MLLDEYHYMTDRLAEMTNIPQIPPSAKAPPRTILFLVFPSFQLLDVTGPLVAFEIAARFRPGAYKMRIASFGGGRVASSAGVALETEKLGPLAGIDTLLCSGGDGTIQAMRDEKLIAFVRRADKRLARIASVCSGAGLLAAAGVLDGRRATTHWQRAQQFQKYFPAVRIEPDSIWVRDGKYWTSAGITAGIDLALAMIADDIGPDVAKEVARQMVVYAQRPGGQTQHSRLLDLGGADNRFAALNAWMREHLDECLSVEILAARMNMSARTFARLYAAETGVTPAKAVERLRIEAARALIESGAPSMEIVARRAGFHDIERMRRAFVRLYGAPPSSLRRPRLKAA
jgi:transcriptional regulator GlxA family with amidase domain